MVGHAPSLICLYKLWFRRITLKSECYSPIFDRHDHSIKVIKTEPVQYLIHMKKTISALTISVLLWFSFEQSFAQVTDNFEILLKEDGIENAYPRLSADGKKILYQSNRTGKWQLYVMDIKTRSQQRITNDQFNNNFHDWSPDNRWIAFVSDRDGNEEVYIMKTDGSDLKRLTNDPGRDIHPYFSPDGKYILYNATKDKDSFDVYRYTISTGKIDQVTRDPDDETCARYSPDMQKMVLLKNNVQSDDVFLFDPSGVRYENISRTSAVEHGWPLFSDDGTFIYYSSMESGTYSIYRIKPDGTGKQQLTHAQNGEDDARVNVAKDQSWMIYNKQIGKTIMICSKQINPQKFP